MSPEDQTNTSEDIAPKKSSNQKGLKVILLVLMLAAIGATGWYIMDKRATTPINQASNPASYLSNANSVACSVAPTKLTCENLETQELKEVTIPKKYQNSRGMLPSPDGSKLLVTLSNGDGVVTDGNFNEVIKIDDAEKLGDDRYPSYSWGGDSNKVIISEIRREQGDSDELPKPIVVEIFDIESGERERAYKTGHDIDVESIKIIGSNGTHLFVSYPTPKNWVADDTNPPPDTISAVSLSDGSTKTISAHQTNGTIVDYNASTNVFLFEGDISTDVDGDYAMYPIIAGRMEDNETGLTIRKVSEFRDVSFDTSGGRLTITSKGTLLGATNDLPEPFKLVKDDATTTELKLSRDDAYGQLISLKAMPNIQAN